MSILLRFLGAISGSKKATAAVATVAFLFLAPLLTRLGLTITEAEIEKVIVVLSAYLVGQGIADHGKEAAKVEAATSGSQQEMIAELIKVGLTELQKSSTSKSSTTASGTIEKPAI